MTRSTSEVIMKSIGNKRQRLVPTSVKIYKARRIGHNIIPIGLSLLEVYSDTTEERASWSHLIVIPDDGSNRLDGIAPDL